MPKPKQRLNQYIRYSSVGMEMIAALLLAVWLGGLADSYFQTQHPWFTLVLMLLGVAASIFSLIRGLERISREDEE